MRCGILLVVALVALALPAAGRAAPPANDLFSAATPIGSLPFSATENVSEATMEVGEPAGGCYPPGKTVWYTFEPGEDVTLEANTHGSSFFGTALNIYRSTGSGIGNLAFTGCGYPFSPAFVKLDGGQTYYIQVGAASFEFGGTLRLNLSEILPAANDHFADATSVGALPYSDTVQSIATSVEPGEPTPQGVSPFDGTAWYAFTATESRSLMAEAACCAPANVGVYTGDTLGSLDETPVTRSSGRAVFAAEAGTTYRIQLGHSGIGGSAALGITIRDTPDPVATIFHNPSDPSVFDTLGFFASAFDPAGIGVSSMEWNFGDGETGSGPSISHRYAMDGDYEVTLTVATPDGRTGSSTRLVSVRTHDVGIVKVQVPQAASAGHTRSINVSVASGRYDEIVFVQLYRSVPGGFAQVGTLTQFVELRKRSTLFAFSYTFTSDDATVGKVTFKAVATIVSARDALPADNEVVSLPTKVG